MASFVDKPSTKPDIKPPPNTSPAPVGSITFLTGYTPTAIFSFSEKHLAPLLPNLTITFSGPMDKTSFIDLSTFCSFVSK